MADKSFEEGEVFNSLMRVFVPDMGRATDLYEVARKIKAYRVERIVDAANHYFY